MSIKKRSTAEIQRMRGILEVTCRERGCGETLYITSTTSGKYVVLEPHRAGDWVINESDQAVWVGDRGDYAFHRCPVLAEIR